jgi:hypothetical protein
LKYDQLGFPTNQPTNQPTNPTNQRVMFAAVIKSDQMNVSDPWADFPGEWIPAMRDVWRAWHHKLVIDTDGKLDLARWIKDPVDEFEDRESDFSRIRWVIRVHPFSPATDTFTVTTSKGTATVKQWMSQVANNNALRGIVVRGIRLQVDVLTWRPNKSINMPAPQPPPRSAPGAPGDHGELFALQRPIAKASPVTGHEVLHIILQEMAEEHCPEVVALDDPSAFQQ